MKSRHGASKVGHSSPFLGRPIRSVMSARCHRLIVDPSALPFLKDHHLHGKLVLPGAVYVEMAVAMAMELGYRTVCLTAVEFQRAAFLNTDHPLVLQAVLATEPEGPALFRVFSETRDMARAKPHVTMHVRASLGDGETSVNLAELRHRCPNALPAGSFYDELRNRGNDYGPELQGISKVWRGEREAIASVRVPAAPTRDVGGFLVHPVLLDSCVQLALAAEDTRELLGSLLVGVDRIRFRRSPGAACWAHACLKYEKGPGGDTVADIRLLDESGEILMDLCGVRFRALAVARPAARSTEASQLTIAVSATFTAEPIKDSLAFWMRELKIPANLVFAPYNQPFQQLLDPHSVLSTNRNGLNVMLVRVEDWIPCDDRRDLIESRSAVARPAAGTRCVLPNGIEIVHLNQYETEYLYQEIFRDEAYLKHGVVLGDGDCVIDVGANIGLFSLFVLTKCRGARVYAFEPSPTAFDVLACNLAPHGDDIKVFNIGLSDRDGELPFTVYRNSTLFSGFYAREDHDRRSMEAVVRNVLRNQGSARVETVRRFAEELVNARMESVTIMSSVRTLASIIEDAHLDRIDLLKIDAEKSELVILEGLRDSDWRIIRQIVVEVHDAEDRVRPQVEHMLEAHGFTVMCDQEPLLRDSSLSTLYAIRPASGLSPVDRVAATIERDSLDRNATDFIRAMRIAVKRSSLPYLVCLCPPSARVVQNATLRARVDAIEARLATDLSSIGSVQVVKARDILEMYPIPQYGDPRAYELGHVPYTKGFYAAVGTVIARRLHVLWRAPYKVIVLDGDETLWHGRCGEDPPEALVIDVGRQGLQEFMCEQHDAGMLLALCSKNNEEDVLGVFKHRPEMPLALEHFVARRVNWKSKSENISELATELGLGLDSFIFVDDDPVECAETRARCPEVLTLALPAEADKILHFLNHVWAFDHAGVMVKDVERPAFYRQNFKRRELRRASLTFADFLASLEVRVHIHTAGQADLSRVAELTIRTNQFNVTSIRRSESEIRKLLETRDFECLVVDVRDRFGSYGLVGTILLTIDTDAINVDTFLLSCRALGRGVEHRMLAWLGKLALERHRERVDILFVPNGRNDPALMFLQRVGSDFADLPPRGDKQAARVFRFPARFAADTGYQPIAAASEPTAQKAAPQGAARVHSDRRLPPSALHAIATELDDVGRILAAANRWRARPRRPSADASVALDDVTSTVAAVWRDVLGIETVGVSDNFSQLGATSLDFALVVAELERRLNFDVPLVNFLDKTTVGSMARLLKNQGTTDLTEDVATSRLRGEQRRARTLGGLGQEKGHRGING
jgi:FkbH-like protein/FkbM family methyltransferase